MEDKTLRKMIRKEILSSLQEADVSARSAVDKSLGRVEKMASVKMLKKALGTGTPKQQAAGLLKVVQAISGDNLAVGRELGRMLMKGGFNAPEDVAPVEEPAPEEPVEEAVSKSLSTRGDKLSKTQAFKMMLNTLKNKPASQQAEFVADFVKDLNLKGNITLLIKKIRKVN
tara:strand:- start:638 stop:1150 length:513 start_codon:yes stop_codon:yes gene_type:complete